MKKKIAFVYGTRPEFIKIARPAATLRETEWATPYVIATGQHEHLTRGIGGALDIETDISLDIGKPGQTLEGIVSAALPALVAAFTQLGVDGVVVQGDAHSAFVGALAAFYLKLPVAHIEAGLRTENKYSPFPEEMNRRLITQIADIHFPPTARAEHNVWSDIRLGKTTDSSPSVVVTGNTEIDAAAFVISKIIKREVPSLDGRPLVLVTAHRRESHGAELEGIFDAIGEAAFENEDHQFLLPLHPNPNVQRDWANSTSAGKNLVTVCKPLEYMDCMAAIQRARLILTDSGGIQENAAAYGTPVLVLRNETERQEGIDAGCAILTGTDPIRILETTRSLLRDATKRHEMSAAECPYGQGTASSLIVKTLEREWNHE